MRQISAVAGRLALLLVVGAMACCAPAAAARARPATRPTVVAASGFRPSRSGYAFANYGSVPGLPNLGSDEMRQLFGNGVCAGFQAGVCVLSPPALAWMQLENAEMAAGHCVGFSVTALFFYARLSSPRLFGATAVPRLTITGNQLLAREIAYGYVFQDLDSVRRAEVSGTPRKVLMRLASALRTRSELYTLAITRRDGLGGHAVTPYEIERVRPDQYAILVYDNNYPRESRTVQVNTRRNTWSYSSAPTPNQPGSLYTGDATSHSLFLLPTRPGLGVQPCPFCSPTTPTPTTTTPTTTTPTTTTPTTTTPTTTTPTTTTPTTTTPTTTTPTTTTPTTTTPTTTTPTTTTPTTTTPTTTTPTTTTPTTTTPTTTTPTTTTPTTTTPTTTTPTTTTPGASAASAPYEAITLQTVGPVDGELLITDRRGRRVGFVDGRLVDRIPGARIVTTFVGGARTWLDRIEPEYELPVGRRYRIELTGETTLGSRRVKQSSHASVTVLEPGFLAAVRGIATHPGQQDQVNLPASGHAISFLSHGTTRQAPELVLGNAAAGANDHEWNIADLGAPAGRQISASLNVAKSSMSLVGASRYDLSMDMVGNGVSVFAHRDFAIGAGMTADFAYTNWVAGDAMPVTETEHGVVVGRLMLNDEPDPSDTGREFEPTESTPAPVEPQPRPAPRGATATTLVCSPARVRIGDATTCHVDVSDLDSYAPGTPGGAVVFSTDSGGSFSEAFCTLAGGSCEVAYTPTLVGLGTHDITASYVGEHTYHPSDDTISVQVTPLVEGVLPVGGAPGAAPRSATKTSLVCEPQVLPVNAPTTCTVDLAQLGSGTPTVPTGEVEFSSNESGSFSASMCALSNGACMVTYTPTAVGSGDHSLTASYVGSSNYDASDDTATVHVNFRSTDTSLTCKPTDMPMGKPTICTATTTDIDSAVPTTPTGTVTFSSNNSGDLNGTVCTLTALTNASASCSVTYTPPSDRSAPTSLRASYGGDSSHTGSTSAICRLAPAAQSTSRIPTIRR